MPEPEEITRHHDQGEVIYVDAHPTDDTLRIVDSDPGWPIIYAEISNELMSVLDRRILAVQHIGSTAVPGLPAKPIIDIDLAVADPLDEANYVSLLESIGYVHWLTEPDWHQHRLFKRLSDPRVHLHVFGPDCPEMVRHRMFRDWLTDHPEDRDLYARAKRRAASELLDTGDHQGRLGFGMRYNHAKEPVIHEIYDRMFRASGIHH